MSKEEIALELTKLSFDAALAKVRERGEKPDSQKSSCRIVQLHF